MRTNDSVALTSDDHETSTRWTLDTLPSDVLAYSLAFLAPIEVFQNRAHITTRSILKALETSMRSTAVFEVPCDDNTSLSSNDLRIRSSRARSSRKTTPLAGSIVKRCPRAIGFVCPLSPEERAMAFFGTTIRRTPFPDVSMSWLPPSNVALRSLSLNNDHTPLTESDFSQIPTRFPRLQFLSVSLTIQTSGKAQVRAFSRLKRLRRLTNFQFVIKRGSNFALDPHSVSYFRYLENLTGFTIGGPIGSSFVSGILACMPASLRSLTSVEGLSIYAHIADVARRCPDLQEFHDATLFDLAERTVCTRLLQSFSNLKSIDLPNMPSFLEFTPNELFPSIERVKLCSLYFSWDHPGMFLMRCPNLRSLEIHSEYAFLQCFGLKQFVRVHFSRLVRLKLVECGIRTRTQVASFQQLRSLKELVLDQCVLPSALRAFGRSLSSNSLECVMFKRMTLVTSSMFQLLETLIVKKMALVQCTTDTPMLVEHLKSINSKTALLVV